MASEETTKPVEQPNASLPKSVKHVPTHAAGVPTPDQNRPKNLIEDVSIVITPADRTSIYKSEFSPKAHTPAQRADKQEHEHSTRNSARTHTLSLFSFIAHSLCSA